MKISISLPADDVAALDEYARSAGFASRSAAVLHAVQLLRHPDLEADYAAAWDEWEASGDRDEWEQASADGLGNGSR